MSRDSDTKVFRMGGWSPGCGCDGGCGLEVYVKDGKVIKVEGDPEHPWYHGNIQGIPPC
jgi:anaerobic selenocysteine-containing dehydrogenase